VIIVHAIVKDAAARDGSATTTVRRQVLEPSELRIPPCAIWIDLIEPTVDEDRKVQEFVGVPVPTKADPDYTEPPEAHFQRTACTICMHSSSANQRTRLT
jgi:Mg2+ and Co2+ transporter CorA